MIAYSININGIIIVKRVDSNTKNLARCLTSSRRPWICSSGDYGKDWKGSRNFLCLNNSIEVGTGRHIRKKDYLIERKVIILSMF
jgi:hypothetical protein